MSALATLRRDRAHERAGWASSRTPSPVLARIFGISESRVRHQRSDDQGGALTLVCAAVADPRVDAEAVITAIAESYEDRFLDADPKILRARLDVLRTEQEHVAQAAQDRALMNDGQGTNDALRRHATILNEIVAIRVRLGFEL